MRPRAHLLTPLGWLAVAAVAALFALAFVFNLQPLGS